MEETAFETGRGKWVVLRRERLETGWPPESGSCRRKSRGWGVSEPPYRTVLSRELTNAVLPDSHNRVLLVGLKKSLEHTYHTRHCRFLF